MNDSNNEKLAVPSFLYGKFADVKRETGKVVSRLKKGVPVGEIVSNYDFIEVGSVPGKLVLDGPNPLTGIQEHFNLFALPRLLVVPMLEGINKKDETFNQLIQNFFSDMMGNFWSHLVLSCGQSVYNFYNSEQNRIFYLKNLIIFQDKYVSINSFFDGLPFEFWNPEHGHVKIDIIFDHPNFIAKFVLGNLDYYKNNQPQQEMNSLLIKNPLSDLLNEPNLKKYINESTF